MKMELIMLSGERRLNTRFLPVSKITKQGERYTTLPELDKGKEGRNTPTSVSPYLGMGLERQANGTERNLGHRMVWSFRVYAPLSGQEGRGRGENFLTFIYIHTHHLILVV
ncbi:hypothetical protein GE21DRAFT_1218146 [Neurospora crassa]|uniref:Uncharacterized protein n=1 Tax=Neurospora crassa TaxID=5141 RepID=Q9C1L6_NEUCS|nr:hypothetical protein G6G8.2 [Neurospora crassa]KHE80534.1 hypothetical protein GE21DRAFT_1218146 [Neurospora crassa]